MYVQIISEDPSSQEEKQKTKALLALLKKEQPDLRCEVVTKQKEKPIRVQCFGEFEVFGREGPVTFKRARTKELLAVLVCHRGSMLTMGTIMSILWEDGEDSDSDRSYLRTLISDLKKTFAENGADDTIIKNYNSIGLNTGSIQCDYYDFLDGKVEAVKSYNGQFMKQYSWAEYEISWI
ncbi:MAG: winged helix-turn-helix domain-containing protein [Lachnospiraceae bacterium]|nr:winged helix-turn-helix domain-containing protein [Lachnospiraceae bacterium]